MHELEAILHQEIGRLPAKYLAPFVLCCLEGKSRADAAEQLDLPEGTISGRIAKARALLESRLARQGITLSAALGAVAVGSNASAAVPVLSAIVIRAAIAFAGRKACDVVSSQAAILAGGVIRAMFISKLKTVTTVVLAMMLVFGGAGLLYSGWAPQDGDPPSLAIAQQGQAEKLPAEAKKSAASLSRNDSEVVKQERAKLEGTWQLVAFESRGLKVSRMEIPESIRAKMFWLADIEGRKRPSAAIEGMFLVHDAEGMVKVQMNCDPAFTYSDFEASSAIDPAKNPKTIDLTVTSVADGHESVRKADPNVAKKGQIKRGIYEFVDNDTYRVCYASPGNERPAKFVTKPESRHVVWVLERVKNGKKDIQPAVQGKVTPKKAEQKWQDEFQKLYTLKDGEVLKRIATPYPECREKVFRERQGVEPPILNTDTTYLFFRYQNNKTVLATRHGYGKLPVAHPPPAPLSFILESGLHFPVEQADAPGVLLATNIDGEFVFQSGTPPEQWAPVLDKIIRTECKLPLKLTLKEIERKVIVLSGEFQSNPRKGQAKNVIILSPAELTKEWQGYGSGTLDDCVRFLNQFANRHVISEVKDPPKGRLVWRYPSSSRIRDDKGRYRYEDAPDPSGIFELIAEQTGLTITTAKRKVRVLFVEKAD